MFLFSETPDGLQKEIDCLHVYCEKWRLRLNTEKSKVLVFKIGNARVNHNWYSNGTQLTVTNRIPCLGLLFSTNGSFHQAQLTLAGQANKARYMVSKRKLNSMLSGLDVALHATLKSLGEIPSAGPVAFEMSMFLSRSDTSFSARVVLVRECVGTLQVDGISALDVSISEWWRKKLLNASV